MQAAVPLGLIWTGAISQSWGTTCCSSPFYSHVHTLSKRGGDKCITLNIKTNMPQGRNNTFGFMKEIWALGIYDTLFNV